MPSLIDHALRIALGTEPRQRLRLLRSLTAAAVYGFSLLAMWQSVSVGLTDRGSATWLSVLVILGVGGFHIAIRTGFSLRFDDPALTLPQMVFAIVSLALGYLINAHVRGMLLMVVALVLVFGAFTLPPRHCRALGWFAVAVFGVAMAFGAWCDPLRFEPRIEMYHLVFSAAVLPTLAILAGQLSQLRIEQQQQKHALRDAMERLKRLATHDDLTGLPNRRHLQDCVSHEVARSRRSGASLCIALIDLDHFKRVNDTLGHAAGDGVLRIFAREARRILRDADVLARWGGEEFLLAMPDTALAEAQTTLDRLRNHLSQASNWTDCPGGRVTFSAGLTLHRDLQPLEEAIQRADLALYAAKRQGRDRVIVG